MAATEIDNETGVVTELDVMKKIASGELSSPQQLGNMWLWAMRITGTGTAYRHKLNELAYRAPENYLTDEFLARCNGLPVIYEHPKKNVLDSEEYADRNIGSICYPYINGDEVWGIARIYDESAAAIMQNAQMSTSPAVVFSDASSNELIELQDGTPLLVEGNPALLDHLAVCEVGVWDKGEAPAGVKTDDLEGDMPKEVTRADSVGENLEAHEQGEASKLDKILEMLTGLHSRVDALECKKDEASEEKEPEEPLNPVAADEAEPVEAKSEPVEAKADAEEDEAARADSISKEVARQVAEQMKKFRNVELSDEDRAQIADVQSRADSVGQLLGVSINGPMMGESAMGYRRRLAGKFKQFSKQFKSVDLAAIKDAALFDVVEKGIYADAQAAAVAPENISHGHLREVIHQDATGRRISEFHGTFDSAFGMFKAPKRLVRSFNK